MPSTVSGAVELIEVGPLVAAIAAAFVAFLRRLPGPLSWYRRPPAPTLVVTPRCVSVIDNGPNRFVRRKRQAILRPRAIEKANGNC